MDLHLPPAGRQSSRCAYNANGFRSRRFGSASNIAEVEHLRSTGIQNTKSRQGRVAVRALLRIVVQKVIRRKQTDAAASIYTDSTFVVPQHVVVGRGFEEWLTANRRVRLWEVL